VHQLSVIRSSLGMLLLQGQSKLARYWYHCWCHLTHKLPAVSTVVKEHHGEDECSLSNWHHWILVCWCSSGSSLLVGLLLDTQPWS
jgi:hypothetical protein